MADYSQPRNYVAECMAPNWYKHLPYSQAVKPEEKPQAREWIGGKL